MRNVGHFRYNCGIYRESTLCFPLMHVRTAVFLIKSKIRLKRLFTAIFIMFSKNEALCYRNSFKFDYELAA